MKSNDYSMSKSKRLLILMDWQPPRDWSYLNALELYFDKVEILTSASPQGYNSYFEKVVTLWRSYIIGSWNAFKRSRNVDVVFAWHAVLGLLLAFWCRMLFRKTPKIVIAQLIEPDRPDGVLQWLRTAFVRFTLKRVELVVVYSRVEVEEYKKRFGNSRTEFRFVPLGLDPQESRVRPSRGYIFSGGRSNRDYGTLFRSVQDLDVSVEVVAQRFNIKDTVPPNVHVQYSVFGSDFDDLVAGAEIVVIPLDRPDESSGQLVVLQAMAHGKAVVVTHNRGILDYIDPGVNAMTVPPRDEVALRTILVELMHNAEKRRALGERAKQDVRQFSMKASGQKMAELIGRMVLRSDF
jgi:glycosyltransferase involved in cell wall biosynthesis